MTSNKPRNMPRSQIVTRPTADAMRPHAAHYIAPALALIEHAREHGAAHVEYDLPNRAQEAPAVRALLVEQLAPLGVGVSAINYRRGGTHALCGSGVDTRDGRRRTVKNSC